MRIDLHTHSNRSDGSDTPTELVRAAAAARLTVLGLTDHDTTVGWAEAADEAERSGIALVRGIEISTRNEGVGTHLLGYGVDPDDAALVAMLQRSIASREERIPKILDLLRAHEIADLELGEVAAKVTDGGTIGRPHVAQVLVDRQTCDDVPDAFRRFLGNDGPAYVARWTPEIEDAIAVVLAAGGVPVLAHPRGRRGHVSDERLERLAELGLVGVEVDHQEHGDDVRRGLRGIAQDLDLVITGSSDYHGEHKNGHELGCNTTDPGQFERLQASMRLQHPRARVHSTNPPHEEQ